MNYIGCMSSRCANKSIGRNLPLTCGEAKRILEASIPDTIYLTNQFSQQHETLSEMCLLSHPDTKSRKELAQITSGSKTRLSTHYPKAPPWSYNGEATDTEAHIGAYLTT